MTAQPWHFDEARDAEALTIAYLTSCGIPNVSSALPAQPRYPCLTIQRIGGGTSPGHGIDLARLQLSAWAASKGSARALMASALARLWEFPGNQPAPPVVTDVAADLGMAWVPDDSVTPPQPRYIAGVQLAIAVA